MRVPTESQPKVTSNSDTRLQTKSAENVSTSISLSIGKIDHNSKSQVSLSNIALSDALLKEILPSNYSSQLADSPSLSQVKTSFLMYSEQEIQKNIDSFDALKKKTRGLMEHSYQAHDKVRDMFKHLGKLDQPTEDILKRSESDIKRQLSELESNYSKVEPTKGIAFSSRFHVDITTQEGDKVSISFSNAAFPAVAEGEKPGLGMVIEGDLSEQEAAALLSLYEEISEHIEQGYLSSGRSFAIDTFDLGTSFDSSLLSGFDVYSEEGGMKSSLGYQIDFANMEQTFSSSMSLGGLILNYDMEIVTEIGESSEGKQGILEKLGGALQQMDVGGVMSNQVASFIIGSFDSLLTSNQHEAGASTDRNVVNQAINAMNTELGGVGVELLSELPDYSFSLDLAQFGKAESHESTIDMSQQTETKIDALGIHVSQQQDLEVLMEKRRPSSDRQKQRDIDLHIDQVKQIDVTLNHELELKKHLVEGHDKETKQVRFYDENYIEKVETSLLNNTYKQELEVFDRSAKLSTQEKEDYKFSTVALNYDKPEKLAESRYIREYNQMLKFKREE